MSKAHEGFVSHKLSNFFEKHVFLPDAQFAYRKDLGCTDATANHILTPSEVLRYRDGVFILFSSTFVLPSIE